MAKTTVKLSHFSLATLFIGAALRVVVWWQDRSIFIDEANLLRNFLEKPFADLFRPLGWQQYAPPLFSVAEKASLAVLGPGSLPARLLPLAFGLACLPLAWSVARRWLSPIALALFCLFISLDGVFIRYSTMAKQYSSDCLTALLIIWAAQRFDFQRFRWQWAVGGAVAVWFSMPSVFTFAAVGIMAAVANAGVPTDNSRDLWPNLKTLWPVAAWLASFAAYYLLLLKNDIADPHLRSAHVFLPPSGGDWSTLLDTLSMFGQKLVGFTAIGLACFYVGLAAAVWHFFEKRPAGSVLLWGPPAFAVVACALGQYSAVERLLFFSMPSVLLCVAVGWDAVLKKIGGLKSLNSLKTNQLPAILLLAAILISASSQLKYDWFWAPFQFQEHRDGLAIYEKNYRPGDALFVHWAAAPTVRHYLAYEPEKHPFGPSVQLTSWQPDPLSLETEVADWLAAHPDGRAFVQWPAGADTANGRGFMGKISTVMQYPGGQIFQYLAPEQAQFSN